MGQTRHASAAVVSACYGNAQGTTSGEEKRFREEVTPPEQFETVVEAQLGGGEKTIYSAKDGPPLNAQDPTPRS